MPLRCWRCCPPWQGTVATTCCVTRVFAALAARWPRTRAGYRPPSQNPAGKSDRSCDLLTAQCHRCEPSSPSCTALRAIPGFQAPRADSPPAPRKGQPELAHFLHQGRANLSAPTSLRRSPHAHPGSSLLRHPDNPHRPGTMGRAKRVPPPSGSRGSQGRSPSRAKRATKLVESRGVERRGGTVSRGPRSSRAGLLERSLLGLRPGVAFATQLCCRRLLDRSGSKMMSSPWLGGQPCRFQQLANSRIRRHP